MNKKFIIVLMSVILIAASCNQPPQQTQSNQLTQNHSEHIAKVGSATVKIELADSMLERAKGLSGRDSLAEDSGMLFVFETPGRHSFWMKDTRIPLDFIWIRNGKVMQITANVPIQPGVSDDNLTSYYPNEAIDSMLEVNAGWTAKNGIKVGDTVVVD